jgi:hypothetical protein
MAIAHWIQFVAEQMHLRKWRRIKIAAAKMKKRREEFRTAQ